MIIAVVETDLLVLSTKDKQQMEMRMQLQQEHEQFWNNGYIIIRNLFEQEEMDILKQVISQNERMKKHAQHALDKSGQNSRPSFETIFDHKNKFELDHYHQQEKHDQ